MKIASVVVALALLPQAVVSQYCEASCDEDECVFNVNVNLHAGQLGYYTFAECPGQNNPTLAMEVGKKYKFVQEADFNYFHPLGFSYFADGAHDDVDELEPGIAPYDTNSDCADTLSCPAPMYYVNGTYLGTYSNLPGDETEDEENFGLDDYEPRFFWPFTEWLDQGTFEVSLLFDEEDFDKDIFYFCHIHQFMTGRIKLTKNGTAINTADDPPIPYEFDQPSAFDAMCGTLGLEDYRLPNAQCPDRFVCGQPNDAAFANCIDAMNCKMFSQMTTGVSAESEVALFLHQMIPHHENAINMAKALLQSGDLDSCNGDFEKDPYCQMYDICLSIVNGQNHQVQTMKGLLESNGYPETDDCSVTMITAKRMF